jgi:hypothetical protein
MNPKKDQQLWYNNALHMTSINDRRLADNGVEYGNTIINGAKVKVTRNPLVNIWEIVRETKPSYWCDGGDNSTMRFFSNQGYAGI